MYRRKYTAVVAATLLLGVLWAQGAMAADELTVTLAVSHMTCATCPFVVRKALLQVDGVRSARVDYPSRTATVVYDATTASVSELTAATAHAGYPSTPEE